MKQYVEIYEENKWKKSVERRRELNRYAKIQTMFNRASFIKISGNLSNFKCGTYDVSEDRIDGY